jgi:hypothetical protein
MAKEPTNGPMDGNTKANGRITTCMDVESTYGRTEEGTKVSIRMIKSTDLENIGGLMGASTQASGSMGNSTEKEHINWQQERRRKVFGRKERGPSGWMSELIFV